MSDIRMTPEQEQAAYAQAAKCTYLTDVIRSSSDDGWLARQHGIAFAELPDSMADETAENDAATLLALVAHRRSEAAKEAERREAGVAALIALMPRGFFGTGLVAETLYDAGVRAPGRGGVA